MVIHRMAQTRRRECPVQWIQSSELQSNFTLKYLHFSLMGQFKIYVTQKIEFY